MTAHQRGAACAVPGSNLEVRQIGEERLILAQAAQVEHQALLLNSSDDRSRQFAQHRRQTFQLGASPLGGDGETRARDGFERQRAGADLALAFAELDREVAAERRRHVRQHMPSLRLDLGSRPRQHLQSRKALGELGWVPIEFKGGFDGGQPDLVDCEARASSDCD